MCYHKAYPLPAWLMTFVCSVISTHFVTFVKYELKQHESKGACIGSEISGDP